MQRDERHLTTANSEEGLSPAPSAPLDNSEELPADQYAVQPVAPPYEDNELPHDNNIAVAENNRRNLPARRTAAEVHQFFDYVRNSNLEAAKSMLDIDPGLLLEEQTIGEHDDVSGLLLARRMGDVGMCKMMLDFLKAYDAQYGTNHTNLQIKNVSENLQKKTPFNVKHFDNVAAAIASYQSDAAAEVNRHRNPDRQRTRLSDAMDSFRRSCDEHGEFTEEDLMNVFNAIASYAGDKFESYDPFNLFFLQVIGYVERKVPLYLRMALNRGIFGIMRRNNVVDFARVTECFVNAIRYSLVFNTTRYSLVDFAPNSGLGFDFAFDCCDAAVDVGSLRSRREHWFWEAWNARRIRKFCQATESAFVELGLPRANTAKPKSGKIRQFFFNHFDKKTVPQAQAANNNIGNDNNAPDNGHIAYQPHPNPVYAPSDSPDAVIPAAPVLDLPFYDNVTVNVALEGFKENTEKEVCAEYQAQPVVNFHDHHAILWATDDVPGAPALAGVPANEQEVVAADVWNTVLNQS